MFNQLKIKNELDFINTIDKKSSLETANELVKKMPLDQNMTDILEINRKPFRFDTINKEDIMSRLNLLTTDNARRRSQWFEAREEA